MSEEKKHRPSARFKLSKKLQSLLLIIAILLVGSALIATTFGSPVKSNQYQAVFLTNGEVYFGKITNNNLQQKIVLEDVYYLRAANALDQNSGQTAPQLNLIKLGEELHGPEDVIFIPIESVIYWENLREDGEVTQAIAASANSNNVLIGGNAQPQPMVEQPLSNQPTSQFDDVETEVIGAQDTELEVTDENGEQVVDEE